MVRIRLRALCSLLNEKNLRRAFSAFEGNAKFKRSKQALLEKMPLPRRKKWWEKLSEHQHDHFYQEAVEMYSTVPRDYQLVYKLIIEHQLIKHILVIQRFIKKRNLQKWLME